MKQKIFLVLTLISQLAFIGSVNARTMVTNYFSDTFTGIKETGNAVEKMSDFYTRALRDGLYRPCGYDKKSQFVNLIITGSTAGSCFGCTTFYVNVYYSCS